MKYLCVFDLDDTLLSHDKTISSENIKALEKLRELDIGITIATGRSPFLIGKYVDLLSLTLPVIACNGGMIVTYDNKSVIYENPIQTDLLNTLLKYLLEQKSDFVAYTAKKVYYSPGSNHVKMFRDYNSTVPEYRRAPLQELSCSDLDKILPNIDKILLYDPTPEQISNIMSIPSLEVLSSADRVLDIMQDGSTKGNAVLCLGKYLNIPIQNIAVFGDNDNDVSMFSCGAIGISMGNSRDDVKERAMYVTGTNLESGVAKGIYQYVLPHFGII